MELWSDSCGAQRLRGFRKPFCLPRAQDCARGFNNRNHSQPQLSAIDVTEKTFFERLYLVPGLRPFEPRVNYPCAPTHPPFNKQLFLDFCAIEIWPSPGTGTLRVVTLKT